MSSLLSGSRDAMDYESREKLKAEGWDLFGKTQSAHAKRNILMHFIITATRGNCMKPNPRKNYGSIGHLPNEDHFIDEKGQKWVKAT